MNQEPEELHSLSFDQLARCVQEFKTLNPEGVGPRRITFSPDDYERFGKLCKFSGRTMLSSQFVPGFGVLFMETSIEQDKLVPDGFFLMDGRPYKWHN